MPDFTYTARTKEGTLEQSVMSAANERAVADALRARGMLPTSIKPTAKSNIKVAALGDFFSVIKLIDKITLIKNLSVMVKSGLPVSKALKILTDQTSNKKLAKIVGEIARQVEAGTSLADSFTKYPDVFSPIFISMVHVGEVSGNLDASLNYLAEQLQKDYDLVSKARGAMTYPIIVLAVLALVGFTMFTFVLPKLTATFKDFAVQLPITTRVVIFIVDVFAKYGILVMAALIGAVIGFVYWRKTEAGKAVIHKVVLYLPVFAPIVKKINLARFIRVFASLLKSGMPIVEALEVSSHVVANIYYQKTIAEAAAKVKVGGSLSSGFKKAPNLFPSLVVQMMEVGEESGTTDTVLSEVSNFYEQEVNETMKNLSSILEPVIMVVIGAVVGFLAVALITPIYQITQNI